MGNKKILLTTSLLFLMVLLWAETKTYLPSFSWYNPRIMAMGGEVSADPDGFSAFVSNPAGFVGDKKVDKDTGKVTTETDFTLLSIQTALIANPFDTLEMADSLEEGGDFMDAFLDYAISQLEENGMGAEVDLAIASYVGNGWGVGTFFSAGAFFPQSDLALATEGEVLADCTFLVGYAHEFSLPLFDLTVGGDLRPVYRIIVPMDADSLLSGVDDLTSYTMVTGFGMGIDLGATIEWKDFTGALVLRDIAHTRYLMYEVPISDIGNFSSQVSTDTQYITPMSLTLGVGYEPDLPRIGWLVETSFVASYKSDLLLNIDPLSYYDYTQSSFYTSLHFGVETKWLDLIYLRAGVNGGYFTAGAGLDFFIGEINMAIFSSETGRTAGQTSEMGASLELAFRW
ncbi:MAG: hypothetical protein PQJ60_10355 [Spirochaetales bacterium]|nr:hypothetical protein [Spirochaetales bacterium]